MTEQEILAGNKLIAEFIGYSVYYYKETDEYGIDGEPLTQYAYNIYWELIMPVVEKINTLNPKEDNSERFEVTIKHNFCEINRFLYGNIQGRWKMGLYNKLNTIESVWFCVVDFLKWYNKNKDESK